MEKKQPEIEIDLYEDDFIEFVMKELDYSDDILYSNNTSPCKYIEVTGYKSAMQTVRARYLEFKAKNRHIKENSQRC